MKTCSNVASEILMARLESDGARVEEHLKACATCRELDAAASNVATALAFPDEPAPDDWVQLAELIAAEKCQAALPISLACVYCHDRLVRPDASYCASCLAPHHADCFQSHGRCSAPGCGETYLVRAVSAADANSEAKRAGLGRRGSGRRLWWASLAGLAVLAGGAAALNLQPGPQKAEYPRHSVSEGQRQADKGGGAKPRSLSSSSGSEPREYVLEMYEVRNQVVEGGERLKPGDPRFSPEMFLASVQKVVQGTASKNAWSEPASLELHRGVLIVNQTQSAHKRILEFLEGARNRTAICLRFEVALVSCNAGSATRVIEQEEAERLLGEAERTGLLVREERTAYPEQRVRMQVGDLELSLCGVPSMDRRRIQLELRSPHSGHSYSRSFELSDGSTLFVPMDGTKQAFVVSVRLIDPAQSEALRKR